MQFEFVEALGTHGHHPGIVRTRADFRKPDLVAFHEQFDTEDAQAAQFVGDLPGDIARTLQCKRRHGHRLPAFDIIAMHLHMPDGFAKMRLGLAICTDCAHGKLGNFVIEVDETLDDDPALIHPRAAGGVFPCRLHFCRAVHFRLAFA